MPLSLLLLLVVPQVAQSFLGARRLDLGPAGGQLLTAGAPMKELGEQLGPEASSKPQPTDEKKETFSMSQVTN